MEVVRYLHTECTQQTGHLVNGSLVVRGLGKATSLATRLEVAAL